MQQDELLIIFSWCFIGAMFLSVLIPFLRGRTDLLTGWNLFLMGSANFVGASALGSAYSGEHYMRYRPSDYTWFMMGAITFYTTASLVYWYFKYPRRLGGRILRRWPPITVPVLFVMVPASFVLILAPFFIGRIPFVGQLIGQIGNKAVAFAVVISFVAWYRQKGNPLLIMILTGTIAVALILAVMAGGGRRTMVAVVIAIPVCVYWLTLRYKSTSLNVGIVGVFSVLVFLAIAGYSGARHFDRQGPERKERNVANAIQALFKARDVLLAIDMEDITQLLGQNAAEASLLAIHLYTKDEEPQPFHSFIYVLVNPVPRLFWRDKPQGFGKILPRVYGVKHTRATWGPGIIGHGFHEGGLHMLVFYAVLCAVFLRLLDELLMRQPGNPYILGAFTAASGHIIGWPRGDIGTFSINIISSFLLLLLVGFVGRVLFGAGLVYPRTDRFDVTRMGFVPARR